MWASGQRSRKRRRFFDFLRSVDDPWIGDEPFYLGMRVFTEAELAQYAKVSVEKVRKWIAEDYLPTLPTCSGSFRISEADLKQ